MQNDVLLFFQSGEVGPNGQVAAQYSDLIRQVVSCIYVPIYVELTPFVPFTVCSFPLSYSDMAQTTPRDNLQ